MAKTNVWLYFGSTLAAEMYGNLTGRPGAFVQFLSLRDTNIYTLGHRCY